MPHKPSKRTPHLNVVRVSMDAPTWIGELTEGRRAEAMAYGFMVAANALRMAASMIERLHATSPLPPHRGRDPTEAEKCDALRLAGAVTRRDVHVCLSLADSLRDGSIVRVEEVPPPG